MKLFNRKMYELPLDEWEKYRFKNDFRIFAGVLYGKNDEAYLAAPVGTIIWAKRRANSVQFTILYENNVLNSDKKKHKVVRIGDQTPKVHTIIATIFCANPYADAGIYAEVEHIDGNLSNCAASNLRWIPRSERVKKQKTLDEDDRANEILKSFSKIDPIEEDEDGIIWSKPPKNTYSDDETIYMMTPEED